MTLFPDLNPATGTLLAFALSGVLLAASPAESAAGQRETLVYFGTYTGAKSKGIYLSRLDLATGTLSTPELAGEAVSPSFLAIHPTRRFLYAVNEVSNFAGKKSGAVTAFAIEAGTGKLARLNQQPSGGDGPCHLNVDATGKYVLIANYGGGSCAAFPVGADGQLGPASAFVQHEGSSVNRQRQQGPHAHGAYLAPDNRFAFVPDLGLDKVLVYAFDTARGSLTPNEPAFGAVPPGSGPRHLTFHPNGKHVYVINEMLCTITAFAYDPERGSLDARQTISTLPRGESVRRGDSTAEIEVHPNGKFLYGSNRGHDTIAVFSIQPDTGALRRPTPVHPGKNTARLRHRSERRLPDRWKSRLRQRGSVSHRSANGPVDPDRADGASRRAGLCQIPQSSPIVTVRTAAGLD